MFDLIQHLPKPNLADSHLSLANKSLQGSQQTFSLTSQKTPLLGLQGSPSEEHGLVCSGGPRTQPKQVAKWLGHIETVLGFRCSESRSCDARNQRMVGCERSGCSLMHREGSGRSERWSHTSLRPVPTAPTEGAPSDCGRGES